MAITLVNVGTLPNDGEGDPLRVAFQKINNNFVYLQQTSTNISNAVSIGLTENQVIWEYPADEFTQAVLQVQSYREDNNDSQNAFLGVQIYNNGADVKYAVYGLTNVENWLTKYDMDVFDGNVRLLVNPIQDQVIQHFIAYQVTYAGDLGLGSPMISEAGAGLITENNINITTES